MKRQKIFFLVMTLMMASLAFAHAGPPPGPPPHDDFPLPGVLDDGPPVPKDGACAQLKFDKAQKAKLKDAFFKYQNEKIELEARDRKAHLQYQMARSSTDTELKALLEASRTALAAHTAVIQAQEDYRNEVEFSLLKPEQRSIVRDCMFERFQFMEHMDHNAKFDADPRGPHGGPRGPGTGAG